MNNILIAQELPADSISDIAIEDVDILLSAVIARLRSTTCRHATMSIDPQVRITALEDQAIMLECVEALNQIHTTLAKKLLQRLPQQQ